MDEMRDTLERLLRDATLVTIALGIAIGWALFQVAEGVSALISTLLTEYPPDSEVAAAHSFLEPLTWTIDGRILTFGPLLRGLVELVVVLAVAWLVLRRRAAPA